MRGRGAFEPASEYVRRLYTEAGGAPNPELPLRAMLSVIAEVFDGLDHRVDRVGERLEKLEP